LKRRVSPARALRIAHIAGLDYYTQADALGGRIQSALVLASEPVVEACLSIAPYHMVAGGADRALARAALADFAPAAILEATRKGSTTRHHQLVLQHNLAFMRAQLDGGRALDLGLIEPSALSGLLAQPHFSARDKSALTNAFIVEIWLRRFERLRAQAKAQRDEVDAT
jgi:asparagine synthase (glutamine-hydrolysing)